MSRTYGYCRISRREQSIDQQIKNIKAAYPSIYAMKHEIRYFPVKDYSVFYVVNEETKTVEIWRVLHKLQRQNGK